MNIYFIQYKSDGQWITACTKGDDINEVLKWAKNNIQDLGICVTLKMW